MIGDAVGERLAGAMVATVVKSCCDQVLHQLPIAPGPGRLLHMLNASLYRNNSKARASCAVIVMDPSRQELVYANAGHPLPIKLHREKGIMSTTALDVHGPCLGERAEPQFEEDSMALGDEDTLVLVTSGLLKPQDKNHEPFGRERLEKLLRRQATTDAEWIMDEVRSAVTLHSYDDSLRDDQALLIVGNSP